MSVSCEAMAPTSTPSPALPSTPPDPRSVVNQTKEEPMTFQGYEDDPVASNGLGPSGPTPQDEEEGGGGEEGERGGEGGKGGLPQEAGAVLELVDFCSKTTARSQHWSTLSVDSDIMSAVEEFLSASSNPLFKRLLVRENFREVSRWLGARVQVEREGWMLKSRLAMQEIEGHRRQQQHAGRVLAQCATHVRDVLETLHVGRERLEALPSDDCQAALVAGVELLSETCSQLLEERAQCRAVLAPEAGAREEEEEGEDEDSLVTLLDRYLQDKDAAFAAHRKMCTARQRELEEENARLCEELSHTSQVLSRKQGELEGILEQLGQGRSRGEGEGDVRPLQEDKSVSTEQSPSTPSSPRAAGHPPRLEEGALPLPSTSSSNATQTSGAGGELDGDVDVESGIRISEEKLLALKQRARQLEASLHSAISSMESMKGAGGGTMGTGKASRHAVNGVAAPHASGVLHGFSALSVLHYSQCDRGKQPGPGGPEDKSREQQQQQQGGRSRADRVKSERNHPSWSLDREHGGQRAKKTRVQSERNHPTWSSGTSNVNGLGGGSEAGRGDKARGGERGNAPPDWASLQNGHHGERGRQERGNPERNAGARGQDSTERGRAADRAKSERNHPSWSNGGAGGAAAAGGQEKTSRPERARSERNHPSWTNDWKKASFEVTSTASTSALPNAFGLEDKAPRDGHADSSDKSSRTTSLAGAAPELTRSAQIISYGALAGSVASGRTARPRQVDRCLRCQQLYSRTDNHKLACCYHPKGKERREKYSSNGQLQRVTNLWVCCQRPDDSEGCCFGQHI